MDEDRVVAAIRDWWLDVASNEIKEAVPKAVEYSATDLAEIGHTMAHVMGLAELNHADATELGIYFYCLGKMARWTGAIRAGRRVSDDTLHDLSVYLKMAQRTRVVGGWPFAPGEEK